MLFVTGCVSSPTHRFSGCAVVYNDFGVLYSNPYTTDDFVAANNFLAEKIESRKLQQFFEAYFLPMQGLNRLILIPVRPNYEIPNEVTEKLVHELDLFLGERLQKRAAVTKP
jgi:hypothetical protein